MPFNEESWSLFDRSPKHPQFRIGDYVSIEKESTRRLAYITGMNAPSVTGAPWQLDIETLAGERKRVSDSEVKRFSHNEASLADVIRLGFFSLIPDPASRRTLDKLLDEDAVLFFVNLCSDVGRFLDLHPERVDRNIPKIRSSLPSEKQVLAVSRFLAEYGLNFYDCFRRELEKEGKLPALPFPVFGAVYPSLNGNDVAVTKVEFTRDIPMGKNPVTILDQVLVTFANVMTGHALVASAPEFFKWVRNEPKLVALKDGSSIKKLSNWEKDGDSYYKEGDAYPIGEVPEWLCLRKTYWTKEKKFRYVVLNIEKPDDEFAFYRVVYQFISSTGSLGTVHSCSVEKFSEMVLPEAIDGAQEYRVMPVDTQPFDFPEDVISGNVYKSSCVNEPIVVEKVFFSLQASRWFVLVRSITDTRPEQMQVLTVKELLQVGSNGQRHYTRVAKNVIEYFENVRTMERKCQK